ncbi:MAG: hypothetical protein ACE5PM_04445 [Candidatus Hydrothermarchaeales archaeon]
MSDGEWTKEELLKIQQDRDRLIENLVDALVKDPKTLFVAKFGFGFPPIDIIEVTENRTIRAYSVKLPISAGDITSLPYYQGFGEAFFFPGQMTDEPYILVPEFKITEVVPFVLETDTIERLKAAIYDVGLATFDTEFKVKKIKVPRPSFAKKYVRLSVELADIIIKHGKIKIGERKKEQFDEYKKWLRREKAEIGEKMLMPEEHARVIAEKILKESGYYYVTMDLKEGEVESRPHPVPTFIVWGRGKFLGDDKDFRMVINRISGRVIEMSFD